MYAVRLLFALITLKALWDNARLMGQATTDELLRHRISLLAINQQTVDSLSRVAPFVETCLPGIIEDFYAHMQRFPEGRKIFADANRVRHLKQHQRSHWTRLFNAELDAEYVAESIRIGKAHHRHRVPPHLYMAGYSFFLSALLKRLSTRFQNDPQLPLMCEAITKIVGLDTDLAMSVYVREVWREAAER